MAYGNGVKYNAPLDLNAEAFLDTRMSVASMTELNKMGMSYVPKGATDPLEFEVYVPLGFRSYVKSEKKWYEYVEKINPVDIDDITYVWEVATGSGVAPEVISIIDTLTGGGFTLITKKQVKSAGEVIADNTVLTLELKETVVACKASINGGADITGVVDGANPLKYTITLTPEINVNSTITVSVTNGDGDTENVDLTVIFVKAIYSGVVAADKTFDNLTAADIEALPSVSKEYVNTIGLDITSNKQKVVIALPNEAITVLDHIEDRNKNWVSNCFTSNTTIKTGYTILLLDSLIICNDFKYNIVFAVNSAVTSMASLSSEELDNLVSNILR